MIWTTTRYAYSATVGHTWFKLLFMVLNFDYCLCRLSTRCFILSCIYYDWFKLAAWVVNSYGLIETVIFDAWFQLPLSILFRKRIIFNYFLRCWISTAVYNVGFNIYACDFLLQFLRCAMISTIAHKESVELLKLFVFNCCFRCICLISVSDV